MEVTHLDLPRLDRDEFLNDTVIDFYLRWGGGTCGLGCGTGCLARGRCRVGTTRWVGRRGRGTAGRCAGTRDERCGLNQAAVPGGLACASALPLPALACSRSSTPAFYALLRP